MTKEGPLSEFLKVISSFKLSSQLRREARRLNIEDPQVVGTQDLLIKTFLDPNWRAFPQVVDVPANPQIFGQLVRSAQLCGILYASKFNEAKCLAIYPRNFKDTSSFIKLDDTVPDLKIPSRIDASNWHKFDN